MDAPKSRSVDCGHESSARSFGSRGDVHPMIALAERLDREGHEVLIAGPPDYVAAAERRQLRYHGYGDFIEKFLADTAADFLLFREPGHANEFLRTFPRFDIPNRLEGLERDGRELAQKVDERLRRGGFDIGKFPSEQRRAMARRFIEGRREAGGPRSSRTGVAQLAGPRRRILDC